MMVRDSAETVRTKIERDLADTAALNGAANYDDAAEFPRILDSSDPLAIARRWIADEHTREGRQVLFFWRGDFYTWTGRHYAPVADGELRASLYAYCEAAKIEKDGLQPFKPSTRRVSDILDALRAAAILPAATDSPAWLGEADLPAIELLPVANGLLHFRDWAKIKLLDHDPRFFSTGCSDVAFNSLAPAPERWLGFLRELWPEDDEAIGVLQELFGYLLTADTRQQKIFLIVGPKRSGKGTIARILTALVGPANVAAPSLASFASNFGLSPLIGKQLAIIADARLSARVDQAAIAEALLNVSGEDAKTIDRKYREPWTGTLPTRFLLLSNELPRLADSSGALAGRFVVLTLTRSFYGHEDPELTDRLKQELPSIFNWSLKGLRRLQGRGRFVQPASSAAAIQELEDLGSPVGAFLNDCCETGAGQAVDVDALFTAWKRWCAEQGRDHPGTVQAFGRDIRAAVPGIVVRQRRDALKVIRFYEGLGTR